MPKNRGHIESLARSYTDTAIKTLAVELMDQGLETIMAGDARAPRRVPI